MEQSHTSEDKPLDSLLTDKTNELRDEEKILVGMRLTKGLHRRLKIHAAISGEPVNQYAERILSAALDKEQ